jgi:glycerophosphoryl diester phosphodiesterase
MSKLLDSSPICVLILGMALTSLAVDGSAAMAAAPTSGASGPTTILVHGHRGSRATRPENTLPAFQFAIDHGVDVLELDLAVTKDNELVVSHSPFLVQPPQFAAHERVCKGPELPPMTPIHAMTLEQVEQFDCGAVQQPDFPHQVPVPGTHVPTFDQVLDSVAPGTNPDTGRVRPSDRSLHSSSSCRRVAHHSAEL